jgi:hypothetical protein
LVNDSSEESGFAESDIDDSVGLHTDLTDDVTAHAAHKLRGKEEGEALSITHSTIKLLDVTSFYHVQFGIAPTDVDTCTDEDDEDDK